MKNHPPRVAECRTFAIACARRIAREPSGADPRAFKNWPQSPKFLEDRARSALVKTMYSLVGVGVGAGVGVRATRAGCGPSWRCPRP